MAKFVAKLETRSLRTQFANLPIKYANSMVKFVTNRENSPDKEQLAKLIAVKNPVKLCF